MQTQTLTLTIQEDFMPIFMKLISGFISREINIEKTVTQPIVKKRDLSRLVAHENAVNGDPEDLVNMNWEHELHVNSPN